MKNLNRQSSRLTTLVLLFAALTRPGFAETHDISISITDVSAPDSPIKASGWVSFHEQLSDTSVKTQWKIEADLVNASSKTILAYEISIDAVADHGGGVHHTARADHFFRLVLEFAPGAQETVKVETPNWQMAPRTQDKDLKVPQATFKVIFVEFADGLRFGASTWGTSLSDARQLTIEQMQGLLDEHRNTGEQGLRLGLERALTRRNNSELTNAVLGRVKRTLDAQGTESAVAEIAEFLDAARRRRTAM